MAGLYLHIPFCNRKCPYCDFYSTVVDEPTLRGYAGLLTRQLEWAAEHGWCGPFETVYFGGGTPSLLQPAEVAGLLRSAEQLFGLAGDAEISLEANPGTVSPETLAGFRSAGVNRLSLGLQSGNDHHLRQLGRSHDRKAGLAALQAARQAGFADISLDLMFALPGQTTAELAEDLDYYLQLAPEHLSCYGLTAEAGTVLHTRVAAGELCLPDEEFYAEAYLLIDQQLTAADYEHYEIANYAKSGHACRHNLGYWQRRPCLGIGAGAHSLRGEHWGSRWAVPNDLASYAQALRDRQEPMQCLEEFDRQGALRETVYLALRTRHGLGDAELREHFGCTLEDAFPAALAGCAPWLVHDRGHWSLTPAGWLLFDRLILAFL